MNGNTTAADSSDWFEKSWRKKKPAEDGTDGSDADDGTAPDGAGRSRLDAGSMGTVAALPSLSPGDLPTIAPAKSTPAPKEEEIALSARTPDELLKMEFDPGDTGREGARKASGYDRGSYGRGSKALNMWARGQINVATVSEENNERLVIACGKNSNGLPFADFGIRLNPDTMIYEEDPEFDVRAWQAELNGETNSVPKPAPEAVALLVKDLPLARKALKELVMEEFGYSQASAYNLIKRAEGATIRRNAKKEYVAITK